MKATELRIGNYVSVTTTTNKFDIVEGIEYNKGLESHYLALKNVHYGVWFEHKGLDFINPIKLTEEWLKDFGFEIKYEISYIIGSFLGLNPITKDHLIYLTNTGDGWFYKNGFHKIKHVHQLQNLYFVLTGQELTLNEI